MSAMDYGTFPAGQIPGTATNDAGGLGVIGESISSIIASPGSGLTTATSANVTSISLTAGDWDVQAIAYFLGAAGTTYSTARTSISNTTGALDQTAGRLAAMASGNVALGIQNFSQMIPPIRISLASTTTIFLVVNSDFATNTLNAWGILSARRAR